MKPGAAPTLAAEALAWSWPGASAPALDLVSLTLRPGELTALVGPNGSGKSTLLALLAGVQRAQIGRVTHDGAAPPTDPEALARRLAFLPARPVVPPELTGLEVALLGRHPFGRGLLLERPEDVARADAALLRAGAAAFRDRPIGALSSGERQRVLIARALSQEVPALLLDEPTSAQDPAHALDLFALFRALAREGRVVVVATHDLNVAARCADRLVALRAGRVLADGPPAEVVAAAPLAKVFDVEAVLGTDDGAPYAVARRRTTDAPPAPAAAIGSPVEPPPGPAPSKPTPRRLHPALSIAGALLLLVLVLLLAPLVTRTATAIDDLHRPRALLGAMAGCALAACGVVLQAVLRNPLAEPYTLGISSGASAGAALAIHAVSAGWLPALALFAQVPPTYLGAVAGALLASLVVHAIAARRELGAETLLLAGVAVALFCGAIVTMLHFLASTIDLFAMVRWSMGSLSTAGFERVQRSLPLVVAGLGLCAAVASRLAPASLDDDSARSLGVDPVAVRRLAFFGTSLATAGIVAAAGPIGFVGLIVPHAARSLVGSDPRVLLPVATLLGGAILASADVLARTLAYPTELPISVITHALGCPAFVWILVRRR